MRSSRQCENQRNLLIISCVLPQGWSLEEIYSPTDQHFQLENNDSPIHNHSRVILNVIQQILVISYLSLARFELSDHQ